MPFWLMLVLFGLITVAAHFLEGITGFGSTALSMPFLTILLGVEVAKPVLTLYTLLLCLYILIRAYRDIDWKSYARMMCMLVLGLPIGIAIYNYLPQRLLLGLLAAFMIIVSVRGLLYAFGIIKQSKPLSEWIALILVFLGGIMHGAFSSGGPLIIIYATEKMRDKSRFRATMCMIWLTLNTVILLQMGLSSQLTAEAGKFSLWGLPCLIAGTLLGDWAHRRIQDKIFTKLTFGILLLSGIFIAVKL